MHFLQPRIFAVALFEDRLRLGGMKQDLGYQKLLYLGGSREMMFYWMLERQHILMIGISMKLKFSIFYLNTDRFFQRLAIFQYSLFVWPQATVKIDEHTNYRPVVHCISTVFTHVSKAQGP